MQEWGSGLSLRNPRPTLCWQYWCWKYPHNRLLSSGHHGLCQVTPDQACASWWFDVSWKISELDSCFFVSPGQIHNSYYTFQIRLDFILCLSLYGTESYESMSLFFLFSAFFLIQSLAYQQVLSECPNEWIFLNKVIKCRKEYF